MNTLTVRAARWSARHPWRALLGWLLFVALCLGAGSAVGTNSAKTADYRVGEAGRAEAMAAEGHLERLSTEQVLISTRSGHRLSAQGHHQGTAGRRDPLGRAR